MRIPFLLSRKGLTVCSVLGPSRGYTKQRVTRNKCLALAQLIMNYDRFLQLKPLDQHLFLQTYNQLSDQ
jgi:hypothetical protein